MLNLISEDAWRLKYIEYYKRLCCFLDDNGIEYTLAFASMLGCVRENQMIKWDYDIDFFIDLKNIKKLISIRDLLPSDFVFVQDTSNGIGLHRVIIKNLFEIYNHTFFNCFFDFFEYVSIDSNCSQKVINISNSYKKVANLIKSIPLRPFFSRELIKLYIFIRYKSDIKAHIRKKIYKYQNATGNYIFVLYKALIFDKPNKMVDMVFENMHCKIFSNYKAFLTKYFGDDYMVPKQLSIYNKNNFLFFEESEDQN